MRKRKGQAIVEAALALPIILMLLAVMCDYGRAFLIYREVDNAVDTGARRASLSAKSQVAYTAVSNADTILKRNLSMEYINCSTPTISPTAGYERGTLITVKVACDVKPLFAGFITDKAIRVQAARSIMLGDTL